MMLLNYLELSGGCGLSSCITPNWDGNESKDGPGAIDATGTPRVAVSSSHGE